jgi:hypothetical protein
MKEKGDESGLHIIIFDELDAICKQRGSTNNGTGVGDSVVNQLLSKVRCIFCCLKAVQGLMLCGRWTEWINSITFSSLE